MQYISTRNKKISVSGAEAIVKGLSPGGGLFVPSEFPKLKKADFNALGNMDYAERASFIIGKFLPELKGSLDEFTKNSYSKFDEQDGAPLVKLDNSLYMLELWHGPTYAFKDVALTLLPSLLAASKQVVGNKNKTLVLVATSGDTGKAALEGFKNADSIDVVVLYPTDGVSNLQKLQMQTTTGSNVKVYGINGNFDDAQNAVKEIFACDESAKKLASKGIELSSANSINIGRLLPQVVYYISAYVDMLNAGDINFGDKINFCVPTGNFGNILAGYYAMQMGLPVNKLICASNKNNVLTNFFNSGTYDIKREFYKTSSPSMDILISSNLERLLFELSGRDDKLTASRIADLKSKNKYSITDKELKKADEFLYATWASEDDVSDMIAEYFDEYGYICDTHTAVALSVYHDYLDTLDKEHFDEDGEPKVPTVIVSTASPYKFVKDVLEAIDEKPTGSDKKDVFLLEEVTALPVPDSLRDLFKMQVMHKEVLGKDEIKEKIMV